MINIKLLGDFTIEYISGNEVRVLSEEDFHSPSLICLMAYIAVNHDRQIPAGELENMLFEDRETKNPTGTLKNQIYRLRTLLKKLDDEEEFISTGKRAYFWNPQIVIRLDTEQLKETYDVFCSAEDLKIKEQAGKEIMENYNAGFLKKYEDSYWINNQGMVYDAIYRKTVCALCEFCLQREQYEEMEDAAAQALAVDPLTEEYHYYLIRALIGQEKYQSALGQYKKTENILYENLTMETTEKLQKLWPLLMEQTHSEEKNIHKVQTELMEDFGTGAFFCEYGTFRKIYQLEIRKANRTGTRGEMSLVLIRFTVSSDMEEEKKNSKLQKCMGSMKDVLIRTLRSGDVISRYSRSQYLLLLPTCGYDTTQKVIERIDKAYCAACQSKAVKLQYYFDTV